MPSIEIHTPSSNRRRHGDNVEKRKKSTRRSPFMPISSNTPLKSKQTKNKPLKCALQRTCSAPVPQSPPMLEKEVKVEERRSTDIEEHNTFRTSSRLEEVDDEQEELWTLKRANPVIEEDNDDDDEFFLSPTKRARIFTYLDEVTETLEGESSERQILFWDEQINEDKNGFIIRV